MHWLLHRQMTFGTFRGFVRDRTKREQLFLSGVLRGRTAHSTLAGLMEELEVFTVIAADATWAAAIEVRRGKDGISCFRSTVSDAALSQHRARTDHPRGRRP